MKHFLTLLCALMMVVTSTSCKTTAATGSDQGLLHPDQVFTVTDDDIARETRQINSTLQGEWKYNGPSVDVKGKNLIAGMGKAIAKGKLKKKLKKAFKKVGLDKARPQFAFNEDGTCAIRMLGTGVNGTYNYNPSQDKITIKWHGVPITARLKRDGKKMHITFDTDKFLSLMSLMGKFSDSSAIKALTMLIDNYDDVMVGFELKQ